MTAGETPRAISFGKFLLLERIHKGSESEVFLAKTFGVEGFEKFVAIKRMRPTAARDENATSRFIDSAKRLGSVSHANVTPIYELGKVGHTHYMGLEHVWGQDLHSVMKRAGNTMPASMAAFIGAKLCEGLHFAHSRRVRGRPDALLHLDVEPGNVMISYEGAIKLIDFAAEGDDDSSALLDGRFHYRSPELISSGADTRVDVRADIYSVGACIYEMLTGVAPDAGAPKRPSALRPDLPAIFDEILNSALARDRRDRPRTAAVLQSQLLKVLTSGGRPFTTSRLAEWMRAQFIDEMAASKARLNLYAQIDSAADAERFSSAPPPQPDEDPFAHEPTVVMEPLFSDWAEEENWDEAPTQVYFSSGTLSQEGAALDPKGMLSAPKEPPSTVQVSADALAPYSVDDEDTAPGGRKRGRRKRTDTPVLQQLSADQRAALAAAGHAPRKGGGRPQAAPSTDPTRAPVATRWYLAGFVAAMVIGAALWFLLFRAQGHIEVREVNGLVAEVSLDGEPRGVTPLRIESVSVGRRRLRVAAMGHLAYEGDVTVNDGTTRLVEVALLPKGGEPAPTPAPASGPGTLIITTYPVGAQVSLDGSATGRETPVPQMRVGAGQHRLRLRAPDGREVEEDIFVESGETLRIMRRFPPAPPED